jgi:hypothetical protein
MKLRFIEHTTNGHTTWFTERRGGKYLFFDYDWYFVPHSLSDNKVEAATYYQALLRGESLETVKVIDEGEAKS